MTPLLATRTLYSTSLKFRIFFSTFTLTTEILGEQFGSDRDMASELAYSNSLLLAFGDNGGKLVYLIAGPSKAYFSGSCTAGTREAIQRNDMLETYSIYSFTILPRTKIASTNTNTSITSSFATGQQDAEGKCKNL